MTLTAATLPLDMSPCFDVNTTAGFKAFSDWLFESQAAAHARAEVARAAAPVRFLASDSIEPFTQAELVEMDMEMHRFKQPLPGNPMADGYEAARQRKAIAIERGSRRFT